MRSLPCPKETAIGGSENHCPRATGENLGSGHTLRLWGTKAELAATKNNSRSNYKSAFCPSAAILILSPDSSAGNRLWGITREELPRGRALPSTGECPAGWDGLQGHRLCRMHGSLFPAGRNRLAESKHEPAKEGEQNGENRRAVTLRWVLRREMPTERGRQTLGNKFPFHLLTSKCLKLHHWSECEPFTLSHSPVAVSSQQDTSRRQTGTDSSAGKLSQKELLT